MKKYKVNQIDKKLITEEVNEVNISELPRMIKSIETNLTRNRNRISQIEKSIAMQEMELKELKKLAGENNVKY